MVFRIFRKSGRTQFVFATPIASAGRGQPGGANDAVYDGDTLRVLLRGSQSLRFLGCDTAELAFVTRAIAVETAGRLQVVTASGDVGGLFVAAGIPFPIRVRQVLATGTTASGIVGLA